MKALSAACLMLMLCAGSVRAEGGNQDMDRGMRMLNEGGRLLLRGLMAQMQPQLRDLADRLGALMQNLDAYEAPEVLPNGDIIIRRKHPLAPGPRNPSGGAGGRSGGNSGDGIDL